MTGKPGRCQKVVHQILPLRRIVDLQKRERFLGSWNPSNRHQENAPQECGIVGDLRDGQLAIAVERCHLPIDLDGHFPQRRRLVRRGFSCGKPGNQGHRGDEDEE